MVFEINPLRVCMTQDTTLPYSLDRFSEVDCSLPPHNRTKDSNDQKDGDVHISAGSSEDALLGVSLAPALAVEQSSFENRFRGCGILCHTRAKEEKGSKNDCSLLDGCSSHCREINPTPYIEGSPAAHSL